jgi:zinc and cadmium transporter
MQIIWIIILSTFLVSLISLGGIITLILKKKIFKKILMILVAFAAGTLLGASFFDILPEVIEEYGTNNLFYVLAGILTFFIIEKYINWHHCHEGDCNIRPFAYLNLIGDGVHNLIDGILIAASYFHSFQVGLVATMAIAFHEIPQELADFGLLVHAGLEKKRALILNLLSAMVSLVGALLGIVFVNRFESIIPIFLSISAGGFIYLALVDIVPEIHKETDKFKIIFQSLGLVLGLFFMFLLSRFFGH